MSYPKCNFKNVNDLIKCMEEWKHRLFLDDWIIRVELKDNVVDSQNNSCYGLNCMNFITREAIIQIRKYDKEKDKDTCRKFCMEQTLVHELLHCIYNWLQKDYNNHEAAYYDNKDHQQLDKLADSLIMAKYNIPFEWFINKKD